MRREGEPALHVKNYSGENLVFAAAIQNNPRILRKLLEYGVDAKHKNNKNISALDIIEKNELLRRVYEDVARGT